MYSYEVRGTSKSSASNGMERMTDDNTDEEEFLHMTDCCALCGTNEARVWYERYAHSNTLFICTTHVSARTSTNTQYKYEVLVLCTCTIQYGTWYCGPLQRIEKKDGTSYEYEYMYICT